MLASHTAPGTQALGRKAQRNSRRAVAVVQARAQHQDISGSQPEVPASSSSRRQLLAAFGAVAVSSLTLGAGKARADGAATPFLASNGARGILAEEEERLFRLRQEKEGEARARLLEEKNKLEEESRLSMAGKLCATPFGVDIVGITEFVALVGALVGGITARQRKEELERLNEQLRKINLGLRQQARAGTVYAPGLSYAPAVPATSADAGPPPSPAPRSFFKAPSSHGTASPAAKPQVSTAATAVAIAAPSIAPASVISMEEDEMSPEQLQCRDALRAGKRLLKERNGAAAMVRFEKALMLSKAQGDKVQERRAMRGLAASARLQGQYKAAIKHLERVLDISRQMHEYTGDADAYGTIADCYTDMGEFEKAAQFYDKYIERLNGPDGNAV